MDKLSELPPADTKMTPQENEVMNKYFGDATPQEATLSWSKIFKLALYTTLLFLALSNPITENLFSNLPYCGNSMITVLLTKAFLFMVMFIAIYKFA